MSPLPEDLSPQDADTINEDDQLVKIMQVLNVDELDTSFLTDEYRLKYVKTISKLNQSKSSIEDKFPKTSKGLVEVLKSMLEFNPHFRLTADQLLQHTIFDKVRTEVVWVAPHSIAIDIDENEFQNAYCSDGEEHEHAEDDCRVDSNSKLLKMKTKFVKEFVRIQNMQCENSKQVPIKYKIFTKWSLTGLVILCSLWTTFDTYFYQ